MSKGQMNKIAIEVNKGPNNNGQWARFGPGQQFETPGLLGPKGPKASPIAFLGAPNFS